MTWRTKLCFHSPQSSECEVTGRSVSWWSSWLEPEEGPALDSSGAGLSLQKADLPSSSQEANLGKEKAFHCQISDVDCRNMWSESVWDGVEDRFPGQVEERARVSWSGHLEAVHHSLTLLAKPAPASPTFPAKLKLLAGDSAVGFEFAFLLFPRGPNAFLHRSLKLLLMSSFEMRYSCEGNQDLLAVISVKDRASLSGVKLRSCCWRVKWDWAMLLCSFWLSRNLSQNYAWAQTCLLQSLSWRCQY